MMIERHYDEETLLALMEKPSNGSDAHLQACSDCADKLESFRTVAGILHEHDVWDSVDVRRDPVAETIANLRAFADRMAFEDTAADAILPELLTGPREEWMPRLLAHPEWRTAGVVRRLVATAYATIFSNPVNGAEIASLAVEVAEHLDPLIIRADTAARLRGVAWRERAYALFYTGKYTDALAAADRADVAFDECVVDEYDRARVALIRSLALRPKEDLAAAMAAARLSADTYERFEDAGRLVSARLAQIQLLFSRGDYEGAVAILQPLERHLRDTNDALNHARVLNNLGACLWKLGRLDEAVVQHNTAAMLFDALGIHPESARSRWNVALVLMAAGRVDEAHARLGAIRDAFTGLGMTSEATLVSLDLAELLLAREQFDEVEQICQTAMRSLEAAGLSYTSRALTALAYLREAAQRRIVTSVEVKHVREYIRRLPHDGQLLFAPPPLAPELANSR